MAEEKLDLLQLATSGTTEASATPPEIVRREFAQTNFRANSLTTCQTSLSVTVSPRTLPALLTRRKRLPVLIPAAVVQSFNRPYTQSGTGTVSLQLGGDIILEHLQWTRLMMDKTYD
jgi:hypothetical protein